MLKKTKRNFFLQNSKIGKSADMRLSFDDFVLLFLFMVKLFSLSIISASFLFKRPANCFKHLNNDYHKTFFYFYSFESEFI